MSLQIKPINKNKKAVSVMIGYVLLITMAVAIGGMLYTWMKTYVPKDTPECADGISVFIEKIECAESTPGNYTLNITIVNNGRFDVGAYSIHGSNDSSQKVASLDLSQYTPNGKGKGGIVLFSSSLDNSFSPSEERKFIFKEVPSDIEFVEIIPVTWNNVENKLKMAICTDAKVKKDVVC